MEWHEHGEGEISAPYIRGGHKTRRDTGDLAHSQKLLAHKNRDMTEHSFEHGLENASVLCAKFKGRRRRSN